MEHAAVRYDELSSIIAGGFNPTEKPGYHAMMFSYLDDSADPRRERYAATGGLIATEEQWTRSTFYTDWSVATLNLTEPFRSTNCETQHGQFKDWPKPKCDAALAPWSDTDC
jgi:hypothetical protein